MLLNNNLVPRIASFQEINLDFYFFNDSVFHFGKPHLMPMFKLMCDESPGGLNTTHISRANDISKNKVIDVLVTEMANRLFTVCAIYNENPYV